MSCLLGASLTDCRSYLRPFSSISFLQRSFHSAAKKEIPLVGWDGIIPLVSLIPFHPSQHQWNSSQQIKLKDNLIWLSWTVPLGAAAQSINYSINSVKTSLLNSWVDWFSCWPMRQWNGRYYSSIGRLRRRRRRAFLSTISQFRCCWNYWFHQLFLPYWFALFSLQPPVSSADGGMKRESERSCSAS